MDLTVDDNSSTGSVDEDAELELSCALNDLAAKVKDFEANMQGRFRQGLDDDDEEEITEDIDHFEEETGLNYDSRHRKDDGEDRNEAKGRHDENLDEWDSQEGKEEFSELKQNIAKLLQSMQEEAKALDDNQTDCKATT
ncbi:uncharacterized protein PITG_15737 [Phytophthora infestans T30-4]|uniref:Uncharacterized protein n=1 Tax=Phytophthora infestans (strain T30-4) TaxID=403677 RepID=D0NSF8_PHYIT|nr:uncharacterized protein PITG_15737 [Phytophthora infestans T30-4]EEY64503.1 conserved hypothetical protein [Phytophthora infestans T30-4]|eukprot:XP_002898006.1 conserved hypothetical protein [Phytophthora infestans T30-4]